MRANRWQLAPAVPHHIQQQLSHIHPILLQVLYNRGIYEPAQIQSFLERRYLESADPFLLADLDRAVERIKRAFRDDETIVIYGDFDVDGVTATVLLTEALRGLGLERRRVRPYIPDRFSEGYGLNVDALARLKNEGAGLVITVDCGIRSLREVAAANELGLDIIVTDHHTVGPELPSALAVINPKRPDSAYPEQTLAGVGIAYKVAQALYESAFAEAQRDVREFLDLVAVGTVADLAPLLGENRQLVAEGLQVLNRLQRPGLAALAAVSHLRPGGITAESIGFALGPRLNAAGRLSHAYLAARLLASNNALLARQLAVELDHLNRERQKLTAEMGAMAEKLVDPQELILIASNGAFQPGVVGLVASRLAEKNYRPVIILEEGPEVSRGSCRSIPEFHITDALDEVAGLLERHGGHARAAGLTVRNENLGAFAARMRQIAAEWLGGQELCPTLQIDAEISLEDIDWALFELLGQLEPTGYANPAPLFLSRDVEVMSHRAVGQDGAHLQLRLCSGNGSAAPRVLPAIAFRQGEWADMVPQYIDVVYTINVNEWNGNRSLQLMVQDMRPAGG